MEKSQRIGLLLLFILFVGYWYLTAPSKEQIARQQIIQDSIAQAELVEPLNTTKQVQQQTTLNASDSVAMAKATNTYGSFAAAMTGESQEGVLENKHLKVTFDSKGGVIKKALLKEFVKLTEDENYEQQENPLYLMENEKNSFEYFIPTRSHGNISTANLNFSPSISGNTITMTASLGGGQAIVQKYVLNPDSYTLDHSLQLIGMANMLDQSAGKMKFRWHNYLDRIELNTNFEKYYSTVYFRETDETSDYCNCRGDDTEEVKNPVEWVSHVNQFFNTSIIAKNKKMENGRFETVATEKDNPTLKIIKTEYEYALDFTNQESIESSIYIGPNEFNQLLAFDNSLEQIIPFGRSIFGTINRWLIRPSFNWLSKFIGSKGIVIIVLIFIIKMILYPLMYKMLHSQAKMGLLKPEIAGLREKFPDDNQKVQMETMKMYREYGVSPLGGCLPMIVQMPIWYALFRFFPASITFRQESFLWATDLSSFDVIARLPFELPAFGSHISLFTLLWAVTTIIYSYYNMRHMDMSANPAMKYIQYIMPITFLFFFNNYASGLTVYMFFSNMFNIAQTVITKKFVFDDDKLRLELETQKNKPKKKGGFQSRLEEAMKQQQELQKSKTNVTAKKKRRK